MGRYVRPLALFLAGIGISLGLEVNLWAQTNTPAASNSCVKCHAEVGDELALPIAQVEGDAHGRRGLSCASCHGGDPNDEDHDRSMDPRKGFVGTPSPRQVQSFCGKCHSNAEFMKHYNPAIRVDQETEYATSVHGKKIAKGDQKAATCVSCHGYHGVKPVKDSNAPVFATHVAETCGRCHADAGYMKPYNIATDQVHKYGQSVHAEALLKKQDLSAPTCNDCHGNHGAVPPGITAVANICGTCHARQSELFSGSPHKSAFDTLGVSECVACHSNHDVRHPSDDWISSRSGSICVKCHESGEPGFLAAQTMNQRIRDLDGKIIEAEQVLGKAARAGMEVSRPRFELTSARDGLINARVVIHGFNPEAVDKVIVPSVVIAEKARRTGEDALNELQFRRKGLAVSLLVIALAVVSIYLKIRQMERDT
jgi:predicted CXXCH cytochrome family protein